MPIEQTKVYLLVMCASLTLISFYSDNRYITVEELTVTSGYGLSSILTNTCGLSTEGGALVRIGLSFLLQNVNFFLQVFSCLERRTNI
jgi:hypothetical protein